MLTSTTSNDGEQFLDNAVYIDAYKYLEAKGSEYLEAVQAAVASGMTPEEIRAYMSKALGPDRQPMVLRCYQAACHIVSQNIANFGNSRGFVDNNAIYARDNNMIQGVNMRTGVAGYAGAS